MARRAGGVERSLGEALLRRAHRALPSWCALASTLAPISLPASAAAAAVSYNFSSPASVVAFEHRAPTGGTPKRRVSERQQSSKEAPIGTVVTDCADCPEMVRIPALDADKTLYVGRFEITWHEYLIAERETRCGMPWIDYRQFDRTGSPLDDNYPVVGLSLTQIDCYLAWLRTKSGKRYRLPSELEWEHLTRAGTTTEYYWGDEVGFGHAAIDSHFNVEEIWSRVGRPSKLDQRFAVRWGAILPVGSFPPNPWGLYDTVGNAIEATTEAIPASSDCLRLGKPDRCEIYAGRGNGIDLDHVDDKGERRTAVTGRYPVTRRGGGTMTGLRVVRDQ